MAPKLAKRLREIAEMRALKTATGGNIADTRRAAKVGTKGLNVKRALANQRRLGRYMLEGDEAGDALIKVGDNPESLALAAEAKKDYYGKRLGEIGSKVNDAGGYVDANAIQSRLNKYADELLSFGKGDKIADEVRAEAAKLDEYQGKLPFEKAQRAKGAYPFKPLDNSNLMTNQEALNEIRRSYGAGMDDAVAKFSPDDLKNYLRYKKGYGSSKDVAESAGHRMMRGQANRTVSPSDYAAAVGGASLGDTSAAIDLGKAAVAAGANKVGRERMSAWVARSADAIAKRLAAAPTAYRRVLPRFEIALRRGAEATVVLHHLLMQNDPEYRKLMEGEPQELETTDQ
jgi:hypothetical protein